MELWLPTPEWKRQKWKVKFARLQNHGEIHFPERVILIRAHDSPELQAATMWHEAIGHAMRGEDEVNATAWEQGGEAVEAFNRRYIYRMEE